MSTSWRGMYWTGAYFPSRRVSASCVLATTRPATDTTTCVGFGSIVIGCSGLGSLTVFVVMASSSFVVRVYPGAKPLSIAMKPLSIAIRHKNNHRLQQFEYVCPARAHFSHGRGVDSRKAFTRPDCTLT